MKIEMTETKYILSSTEDTNIIKTYERTGKDTDLIKAMDNFVMFVERTR